KCGPWTQGPVFLQQLRLLEGFDLAGLGHNSADYLHTLVEASKLAFADRERWYGDPRFASVPLERLLSAEYAAARRGLIDGTPGGDQQDQWTLQFFLNVVDFGMDLQAAVDAPLVHHSHFPSSFYPHEMFPMRVSAEGRIDEAVIEELSRRGHDVHVLGDWAMGEVTAVRFDPQNGLIEGAASP